MIISWLSVILTVALCCCALIGDYIGLSIEPHFRALRAIVDNGTHAVIGGLTWCIVAVGLHKKGIQISDMWQIVGCTLMSSIIDLDHFLAAKSWKLQDATSLNERPFLHNTSLVFACGLCLIVFSFFYPTLHPWGWVWLAAGLSHHTRDAVRRGYTLLPWGETSAIPTYLYILILTVLPQIILICVLKTKPNLRVTNLEEYSQVV